MLDYGENVISNLSANKNFQLLLRGNLRKFPIYW